MKRLIQRIKSWRDRKFRERIDRVYFHVDEKGVKEIRGNVWLDGNMVVSGFCSTLGVRAMLDGATQPSTAINPFKKAPCHFDTPEDITPSEDESPLLVGYPV